MKQKLIKLKTQTVLNKLNLIKLDIINRLEKWPVTESDIVTNNIDYIIADLIQIGYLCSNTLDTFIPEED